MRNRLFTNRGMADKRMMKMIPLSRLVPAILALAALAGCVSDDYASRPGPDGVRQPGEALWACDNGAAMRVRNLGNAVQVTSPQGEELTLPASPPGSVSRYGAAPYALVFDGREALWFKTGGPPVSCRRK